MDNNMENNIDKIIDIDIEDEMQKSYLAYSMSVIMSRALPDVRDGLKPVHRRILYSMEELNLGPDKAFRKSSKLVGDVLGNYHPHSDSSVYDAMVRLAQDFNSRYPLVKGHGNFGSVDGDSAAAMRYTEAKMSKLTTEMLRDINKDTIDFRANYDETRKEPIVLPARFPNLMVNGSSGIAVGMATNIPPHNLGECIDAIIKLIDEPETEIDELNEIIKGPDFPTAGNIMGTEGIKSAYRTGRGKVIIRANCEIEEMKNGKHRILVNEIPYQVNKANLISKIAELAKDKKIEGISALRDESSRKGMRIVIEVKKDYNPNVILNSLYKFTQMQSTFGVIMLAIVEGEPRVLNLKEMLSHYIAFQKEVITRRTQFELKKAEDRDHIVQGLLKAIDNIDEVIRIIRSSYSNAQERLMETFDFSEIQAQSILAMQLRRLQGLEREKLEEEHLELIKEINRLREILSSERMIYALIKTEILEIKEKYSDDRKSRILPSQDEINIEDIIEEENMIITLTHFGYIKRIPEDTYRTQKRGGKGIIGLTTRDEDFVEDIYVTSTHDKILFFTSKGNVFALKAYEIPEAGRQARGTAIINLLNLSPDETIRAIVPIQKDSTDEYLLFTTKNGLIKKTALSQYEKIRKNGIIAITLKDDDELINVKRSSGDGEIIMVTHHGLAIKFKESDVREVGRATMGVKGIDLRAGDAVIAMEIADDDKALLVISQNGFGKRTPMKEYKLQHRGGKGTITYNIKKKTGNIISAKAVIDSDEVLMISLNGTIIRLSVKDINKMGRITQGVTLMKMDKDDRVVAVAKFVEEL